jgi:hypothetical protein
VSLQQAGIVEPEETAVGRQRLDENFRKATDTHPKIEDLLDAVFSVPSISYEMLSM